MYTKWKTYAAIPNPRRYLIRVWLILALLAGVLFVAKAQDEGLQITVSNVDQLQELWSVQNAHQFGLTNVAFVPNTSGLLTASFGEEGIKYWEFGENTPKFEFDQHIGDVTSISLSYDGRLLLSGSVDNTIILWTADFGWQNSPVVTKRIPAHTNYVLGVALSDDGTQALSGSADSTTALWNPATGDQVSVFTGYVGAVNAVAISPDGTHGASGSCGIYVQDTNSRSGYTCVQGAVYILNLETGERVLSLTDHQGTVYSVAFSSDGRYLVTGSGDNTAILWDVESGNVIQRFPSEECLSDENCKKHTHDIFSTSLSTDGTLLLTGSADKTVIIWDVQTGRSIRQIAFDAAVRSVTFNRQSTQFAVGTYGRSFSVWGVKG